MPFYVVTETTGKDPVEYLVEAKNVAGALKAVVEPRFKAEVASPQQLIALSAKGVKVMSANGTAKSEAVGK